MRDRNWGDIEESTITAAASTPPPPRHSALIEDKGAAASADAPSLMVDTSLQQQTLNVTAGATFHLKLRGNPTTGFSWSVRKEALLGVVEQVGEFDYKQECRVAGMVGCPGVFDYTFKALKAGQADVKMDYVRPWLKKEDQASNPPGATVKITVAPAPAAGGGGGGGAAATVGQTR